MGIDKEMVTAKNRTEFVEAWVSEVKTLYGLWNTATKEQMSRVTVKIHELEDLIVEISKELPIWTEADELALTALKFYQDQGRYGSDTARALDMLIHRLEDRKGIE